MIVRAVEPFQIVHEGSPYRPGETVEVPEHLADWWIMQGWAETAPQSPPKGSK